MLWLFIFIVAIIVLVKGADFFVESSEKIGQKLGIPNFIIGVILVSVGTSLPELVSSLFAVVGGNSEIVAGNVIGSNIANILLIIGLPALIGTFVFGRKSLKLEFNTLSVDIPLLIFTAFLFGFFIYDGKFTMAEGLLSLVLFALYVVYSFSKKGPVHQASKSINLHKQFTILALSGVAIYFGAKYTVEAVIAMSRYFGVGSDIIAVTAVALGTSLPELTVGIQAIRRNNFDMAVGDVIGSNIFNTLVVMGIPSFVGTLVIGPAMMLSFVVMLAATLLLYFIIRDHDVTGWEASFLLLFYVYFILQSFGLM